MDYELCWDGSLGFYARFTGWLTPASVGALAHEIAASPLFDYAIYGIVDALESPGHRFSRGDAVQVSLATGEIIGALKANPRILQVALGTDLRLLRLLDTYTKVTQLPVHVFATPDDAYRWLASQSVLLRGMGERVRTG